MEAKFRSFHERVLFRLFYEHFSLDRRSFYYLTDYLDGQLVHLNQKILFLNCKSKKRFFDGSLIWSISWNDHQLNNLPAIDGSPHYIKWIIKRWFCKKNCCIDHKRSKPLKRICPIVVVAFTFVILTNLTAIPSGFRHESSDPLVGAVRFSWSPSTWPGWGLTSCRGWWTLFRGWWTSFRGRTCQYPTSPRGSTTSSRGCPTSSREASRHPPSSPGGFFPILGRY